jgi:hypothetical protein
MSAGVAIETSGVSESFVETIVLDSVDLTSPPRSALTGSAPSWSPRPVGPEQRDDDPLGTVFTGTHIGGNAIEAIAWSVGIAVASYLWASHLYGHGRAGG